MNNGILYLVPSSLGESPPERCFPPVNAKIIGNIRHFIVEEIRTARRFLKKVCPDIVIDDLTFYLHNEHNTNADNTLLLLPALNGQDMALLSEAGIPCVADPGSEIVRLAHESGIRVVPLVGPSSLLLALMSSGFNGQQFVFHGYLPIDKAARTRKLKELEEAINKNDQTQIIIETPYRNVQLFKAIIETCHESILLCLATSLTTAEESIRTYPVGKWKEMEPDIQKKPTVFLLYR